MKKSSDKEGIDGLREKLWFNEWLVSLMTMMIFNGEKWPFAYNVEALIEEIDEHIARLSKTSNGFVTPVRLGAMHSIYSEFIDGLIYPEYLQILHAIKNDLLTNWNGIKKGKMILVDKMERDYKADLAGEIGLKVIKGKKK